MQRSLKPGFQRHGALSARLEVFRYLRKEILTVRSDLLRANSIYALIRLTVAATKTLRQKSARRADIRSVHVASARLPGE